MVRVGARAARRWLVTTARSRFDAAFARFDALVAAVRGEIKREETFVAAAEHHVECALAADHEGDCEIVRRPSGTYRAVRT